MLFLALALAIPAPAMARTTTSYVSVTCWAGWDNPYWRPTGRDGLVEHDGAVIYSDLWVYDAGGWRMVGTEVDFVMDESNARTGVELYRGSFVVTNTLGDFAGTFVWTENGALIGATASASRPMARGCCGRRPSASSTPPPRASRLAPRRATSTT